MTAPGAVRDKIALVMPFLSMKAVASSDDQEGVGQPEGSPPASLTAIKI
jgi:hypothetical protein